MPPFLRRRIGRQFGARGDSSVAKGEISDEGKVKNTVQTCTNRAMALWVETEWERGALHSISKVLPQWTSNLGRCIASVPTVGWALSRIATTALPRGSRSTFISSTISHNRDCRPLIP